jgi:small subunit ribosomal protein S1
VDKDLALSLRGKEADKGQDKGLQGMQGLMESGVQAMRSIQRGDVVEGVVMRVDRDEVLVDIGTKSEGVISNREMQSVGAEGTSRLKVGDQVLVYVLRPENEEGQVVLSLDRATGEKGWRLLQRYFDTGGTFQAEVTGFNKGGLLVNIEGVHGFIPSSQVVALRPESDGEEQAEARLAQRVGTRPQLKVIEINRTRNRVILSERAAFQDWRNQQKERLLTEIREGEIRKGKVTSICSFGAFVDLGGADGLIHVSELAWEHVTDAGKILKVGDEVAVYVMKVDLESKKIGLSLRRAQPEPWDRIVDEYQVGQLVQATITKLVAFGAFARIEGPVEGLIHISELADRHVAHPMEIFKEGDLVTLKIVRIDRDRHRLALSLKQAQEEIGVEHITEG